MIFLYGTGEYPAYRAALDKIGQDTLISRNITAAEYCEGLLLPGGGDIHGELETQETAVIDFFVTHSLPILGICRGMQALNVYFGGTLHNYILNHQIPRGDVIHSTCAAGLMEALLGNRPTVNSNHHQAVKNLGLDLIACQWADDGIIEAICHKTLPIVGVQWHPERWKSGSALFRWFFGEMHKVQK